MELLKTTILLHNLAMKGCMDMFISGKGDGLVNRAGGWMSILRDQKLTLIKNGISEEFVSGRVKISIPQIRKLRSFIEDNKFFGDINFDLLDETPANDDTIE